jgi:hypothetical protein
MNSLVQKYSKSSTASHLEGDVLGVHGKWDASLDLAFPNFDIPGAQNVSSRRTECLVYYITTRSRLTYLYSTPL